MRIFSATLATETNTFSPLPTGLSAYREGVFYRPGEHPDDAPRMCTAPLFVARRRAAGEGFTLIEGSCFAASPAGITNRADYELMRDEILGQLRSAMPLDAVVLGLHGAMVAFGYDDVEGDIIGRARAIVGPRCVIGVELDPHCHLTLARVRNADIIVLYKEFPHTDVVARAEDLLDLVFATVRGTIKPVTAVFDCRQIQSYPTTLPLMRAFVDRITALEGKDGILSVSIAHCFPYGDVAELSSRVLVIADADKDKADRLAARLGAELVSMRGRTAPEYLSLEAGVAAALACQTVPVVVAEPADNAGGGAPSDNTSVLRELLRCNATDAALGPMWDPVAVRLCFDAGKDAQIPLRIGGKIGPQSGAPLDAMAHVVALAPAVGRVLARPGCRSATAHGCASVVSTSC
jgi:microcystin degradation protein MlrC